MLSKANNHDSMINTSCVTEEFEWMTHSSPVDPLPLQNLGNCSPVGILS